MALEEVVIFPDEKESDLRNWRDALQTLPLSESAIERLEREAAEFRAPENITLLCHLVANHADQRSIAALMLQTRGVIASDFRVQTCLNEIKSAVRQQFDGREFRVI